jgi:hypothetical protein
MSKAAAKSKVVLKEDGKFNFIYIMDAIAYYSRVYESQQKHKAPEGEKEYHITLFVDEATKDALIDLPVNKGFSEVDVGKITKGANRGNIKFPLDKYPDCEGLFGFKVSVPEFSKAKKPQHVKVVNKKGEKIDDLIGNGSRVNIKTFAWKNEDGEWNLRLDLVHVLELIEYKGGAGEVEDDVLGVTYDATSAPAKPKEDISDIPFDVDEDDDDYV